MNFQRFEGMGAAVGIVLVIMIITWLGLWGPIDLDRVHRWQQIVAGALTGCLAVLAACIAYRGSSAQARLNERLHKEQKERERLALFIKLEFACRQLVEQGRRSHVIFGPIFGDVRYERKNFVIEEPLEIEEAWVFLDLLPRKLISEMRMVRNSLRELSAVLNVNSDDYFVWRASESEMPYPISKMSNCANILWQSAAVIADTLHPLINQMAPEMDQNEKMIMLYGDYDPDTDFD